MNDDIQLIITALESYTGLPWDYLKVAHPSIEKLLKSCAGTISREDLIEISKTICDRCTMGDKLCDAIMDLLSAQPEIIHCRYCIYWKSKEYVGNNDIYTVNLASLPCKNWLTAGDWYCGSAKRREE